MKFVHPAFLWSFLILAIPLIIHIFNFRRVRRVYFSNVSLLKDVKTETNSFRKLKHLLILLSRLAFFTCLILAFAQPYLPSENQQQIQNLGGLVSIYVDNSYSMQSELGNETYLDAAVSNIQELAQVFPKGTRFQLLTNNFENREQYPIRADELEDRLTEINYSNRYRDLESINKRQKNLLERYGSGQVNQIFWFSDFQKSTLGNLDRVKLDSLNQFYIVPIRSQEVNNVLIDSVWLENPFIKALETNRVNVRLVSYRDEPYDNMPLKLFIDDQQVSTTTVNLSPQASTTAHFNFTLQGSGIKSAKITFEDFPVIFDNEYYFVINASPRVSILNLYDRAQNRYIDHVFSNESVFELSSLSINNLDYNRISSAELVILNEVSEIEGELSRLLREFVRNGGTILSFPPARPSNSYTNFLSSLGVSGARLSRGDTSRNETSNRLALLNIQNPFYQGIFEKVPSNMDMPDAQSSLAWNNIGEKLLEYKNRRPYLSRFSVNRGTLYLTSSPLQAQYTNFAKHAIFVPIMYKIASGSKRQDTRLAYTFQDKTIRTRLETPARNQVYQLVKEELRFIPTQSVLEDELVLVLPEQIHDAGFYALELNENQENLLAFNYGKAESDLRFYKQQEVKASFGNYSNAQIFDFNKNQAFINDFKEKNIQVNLWKYLLIAALIFFFIEILLIRFL